MPLASAARCPRPQLTIDKGVLLLAMVPYPSMHKHIKRKTRCNTSNALGRYPQADYKRGKRFRKLFKALTSTKAMRVVNRYWFRSLSTLGLLLSAHIVCFVIAIVLVTQQVRARR